METPSNNTPPKHNVRAEEMIPWKINIRLTDGNELLTLFTNYFF